MIPYGKHQVDNDDIASVVEVLKNSFLTQGLMVPEFERRLCDYTGAGHCVAVNSGTSGLHVACLALGIGPGDLVWTSPNSFVASANCARFCGADVDFVDIDVDTRNISLEALSHKLDMACQAGRLPKAIVVVHFAGVSCDMTAIRAMTQSHGIYLIEDAAHALGGTLYGQKVGAGAHSDLTVLSFHPVKSITTAEGGAVLTNDGELSRRLKLFAQHGVTRDRGQFVENSDEADLEAEWYYQQLELGYNYRLSDLHAALGLTQLSKLDDFISRRQQLAERYHRLLEGVDIKRPVTPQGMEHAWHLYSIELISHDRLTVFREMRSRHIGVNVHYIPIHLQPYYRSLGFAAGDFPNAESFYQNALTLPIYPGLTFSQQDSVVEVLVEVLS